MSEPILIDLPRHDEIWLTDHVLRIYISRKAGAIMTPNKRAAQAVHAALIAFGVHPGSKVAVLDKGPTVIEAMRTVVHDAGHTELEPGTLTAGTNWPEDSDPRPTPSYQEAVWD